MLLSGGGGAASGKFPPLIYANLTGSSSTTGALDLGPPSRFGYATI